MLNKRKYIEIGMEFQPLKLNKKVNVNLEYYLIESIYKDEEYGQQGIKTYGIEILKKEIFPNNKINVESKCIEHISVNKAKVEKLLETLSQNTVTPVSLYSVLDNLIGISY